MPPRTLIILGGGLAGLPLALHIEKKKKLRKALNVILIDEKEYFEFNCESVRFLVDPTVHSQYIAPYQKFLKRTQFICATALTVQNYPGQIHIRRPNTPGTEWIPYDYLVVALGTRYRSFKADVSRVIIRQDELADFAHQVHSCEHLLIVGGRTVGVEFLGEVLHYHPSKKVTIVHSGETLMDEWHAEGSQKVMNYLKNKPNLTILCNRKVVHSEGNRHELTDGAIIEADFKVMSTGMVANSDPLQEHFHDALSERGYLKVGPTLQVQGHPNVFAIGDITDLAIPKMAANVAGQKRLIAKNLINMVNGKEPSHSYHPTYLSTIQIVSIGPRYAVMALPVRGTKRTAYVGNSVVSKAKTTMFTTLTKHPALV